jgi:hypothetical protein
MEGVMSQKSLNRVSPTTVVLLLLALSTLLKLLWDFNSIGTCDVMLFIVFSKAIIMGGMPAVYENCVLFNHTPFTGWMVKELYQAANGDTMHFAELLRSVSIVADIGLVLGLLRLKKLTGQPPLWALGLFAISPVSIMVSGFHGNIDPIMVMFLFFAALAVIEDRPILCGVLFAAACNIKIVPLMVSPVFIFYWIAQGRRQAVSFMATSGTLMLVGASYGLVTCPKAFLTNVFGYGSFWGGWGISYWLKKTGLKQFHIVDCVGLSPAQIHIMTALKVVLLVGLLTMAWRRRKLGGMEFFTTLAAAFTWIFVVMPGAGPQYMVWFAPFLLVFSGRWWLALTVGSTIFMARFYHSTAGYNFPWVFCYPKGPEYPYWAPFSNLPWGVFLMLLGCSWRSWFMIEKKAPVEVAHEPAVGSVAEVA